MEVKVTSNTELLDKLIKNLSETIKVNVGAFDVDEDKAYQAEYGGTAYVPELERVMTIPPRSFLDVPLKEYLPDELKHTLNDKVLLDSSKAIGEQIGKDGKFVVDVAFDTKGYGKWEENDPEWLAYKQEHGFDERVLHKTGELAESIDYKVIE